VTTGGGTPLLDLIDVSVRYGATTTPALCDVSLTVHAGERVALIGPSGAGKTTILSLANALVLPTSGRVEIMGVDSVELGARAHRDVRRLVGTIPQGNALVGPLRVAQNVASGRLGRWGPLESLRALVRPREKLWDRADQLSGGQQQRVAIARTLFQGARLLLADEPVSALDPARSADVLEVLDSAVRDAPDRALVASLHDAPLALRYCTRIVALRDGRVEFDKPVGEVDQSELDVLYELER
jgi:phosphonate transport system ATP-binding protein